MTYRVAWTAVWGAAFTWSAVLYLLLVGRSLSAIDLPYELRDHDVLVMAAFVILPTLLLTFAAAFHLYMLVATTRSAAVMPLEMNTSATALLTVTALGMRQLLLYRVLALCRYYLPSYALFATLSIGLAIYVAIERHRVRYFYFSSTLSRLVIQIEPISYVPPTSELLWLPFIAFLVCLSSLVAACSFAVMSLAFSARYRMMANLGLRLIAVVLLIVVVPRILQTLGLANEGLLRAPSAAGLSLIDGGLGIAAGSISIGDGFLPWNGPPSIWFVYFPAGLAAIPVVSVLIAIIAIHFTAWRLREP